MVTGRPGAGSELRALSWSEPEELDRRAREGAGANCREGVWVLLPFGTGCSPHTILTGGMSTGEDSRFIGQPQV